MNVLYRVSHGCIELYTGKAIIAIDNPVVESRKVATPPSWVKNASTPLDALSVDEKVLTALIKKTREPVRVDAVSKQLHDILPHIKHMYEDGPVDSPFPVDSHVNPADYDTFTR